jgi:hypothetical protein
MALNAVFVAVTPVAPSTQGLSPNSNTGEGDHEKASTGAYSYSQPEDIPALAKSIRETLMTVKAAPHNDKSERHELARPRAAVVPIGESGASANATGSLVPEALLSIMGIMGIKRKEAIDKGLIVPKTATMFVMNWFASSAAGHCNCQHEPGKTCR